MTRKEYQEYRGSEWWQTFSKEMREEVGACEECGITDTLNVHHKHYRSLGQERRTDVRVLCERCHHNTHILENRMRMFGIGSVRGMTFIEKRDAVQKIIEQARVREIGDVLKKWRK